MGGVALGLGFATACGGSGQAKRTVFCFFASLLTLRGFFSGLLLFFFTRSLGGFFCFQAFFICELFFLEFGRFGFLRLQLFGLSLLLFEFVGLFCFQLW